MKVVMQNAYNLSLLVIILIRHQLMFEIFCLICLTKISNPLFLSQEKVNYGSVSMLITMFLAPFP
jgi:hypothetical protein